MDQNAIILYNKFSNNKSFKSSSSHNTITKKHSKTLKITFDEKDFWDKLVNEYKLNSIKFTNKKLRYGNNFICVSTKDIKKIYNNYKINIDNRLRPLSLEFYKKNIILPDKKEILTDKEIMRKYIGYAHRQNTS